MGQRRNGICSQCTASPPALPLHLAASHLIHLSLIIPLERSMHELEVSVDEASCPTSRSDSELQLSREEAEAARCSRKSGQAKSSKGELKST